MYNQLEIYFIYVEDETKLCQHIQFHLNKKILNLQCFVTLS